MSDFKDFDLDLKKVKEQDAGTKGVPTIIKTVTKFTKKTIEDQCLTSYDTPTTGYSAMCCKKAADTSDKVEPKCIP